MGPSSHLVRVKELAEPAALARVEGAVRVAAVARRADELDVAREDAVDLASGGGGGTTSTTTTTMRGGTRLSAG